MEEIETKTATADADGQSTSAEPPTEEKDMTKRSKKRTTKKAGSRRAPSAAKPTKAPKPTKTAKARKEKPADAPNRVFAIRVTDEELAAIHKTAGPRNATRFVRAVAIAFSAEDDAAFRAVVKEAQAARQ